MKQVPEKQCFGQWPYITSMYLVYACHSGKSDIPLYKPVTKQYIHILMLPGMSLIFWVVGEKIKVIGEL